MERVSEEDSGFIVKVVAGNEDVVPTIDRCFIEKVALRQSASRTRDPLRGA
jgi:hypothetical protein